MEFISSKKNLETIEKLQGGIDRTWDAFIYGDKKAGIRPGNIQVYGMLTGQREVLNERLEQEAKRQKAAAKESDSSDKIR